MKQQINEIKRMQQLAGLINESQLNEAEGQEVANFLNQHKEEVFEKMFGYLEDEASIDDMSDWIEFYDEEEDYICAQTDLPTSSVGAQARFTPFPENIDLNFSEVMETEISGKIIYYFTYDY
jgi:uncharacterized protein YacL (UPF0231 family)